jgi:anti-sigma factor RsiW
MNKPPSWTSREESLLLLNAYLDDELDAASVLDVERRIAADAALKVELARLTELRSALALHLTKEHASDALRRRIGAIAAPEPEPEVRASGRTLARSSDWRRLAASVLLTALFAGAGTYFLLRSDARESEFAAIVAGHQRALLATVPFDVASSDRHTVKPWFDRKLALSPLVIDLGDAGFPLVGGRVDVVDGRPVPVSVYRRREHVISLVAVPSPGSRDSGQPMAHETRDGYSIRNWAGRDFKYSAVSDVADSDLDEFAARWRATAAKN